MKLKKLKKRKIYLRKKKNRNPLSKKKKKKRNSKLVMDQMHANQNNKHVNGSVLACAFSPISQSTQLCLECL